MSAHELSGTYPCSVFVFCSDSMSNDLTDGVPSNGVSTLRKKISTAILCGLVVVLLVLVVVVLMLLLMMSVYDV